jgi:hypothetical protein
VKNEQGIESMIAPRIAYLIDPDTSKICKKFFRRNQGAFIADAIDCDVVDVITFDGAHSLYFDDAGLRNGLNHYMMLDGYPDPLIGKLLLLSNSAEEPSVSMLEVAGRIQLFKPVLDPVIVATLFEADDVVFHISAVEKFTSRIERFAITVDKTLSPWP